MTGKRAPRRRETGGGRGLLLIVALVLAAGIVKYADTPLIASVRERAAAALTGLPEVGRALAVIGGADEGQETREVFGAQDGAGYAISSGGADDVLGREKTLFPDTVDETVHVLPFFPILPVEGTLTSPFGSRVSPTSGQPAFHYGLDIAADEGLPIVALADGAVREVGESDYGKYLIVDHAGGYSTLYAHCSSISAAVGEAVVGGAEIAAVGQTGNATGPHLHLELWKDGAALDPADYLSGL